MGRALHRVVLTGLAVASVVGATARAQEAAPPPDPPAAPPATATPADPEPPPDGEGDAQGDAVPAAPPLTRRQLRKQRRQEAWQGKILPKEADFLQGNVEVRARLAFNGTEPGPFTLLTSLAGWNELGLSVDAGIASWRDWTIGIGGAGWYAQSLILGLVASPIANYEDYTFRWKEWEAGGVVRATMHYTGLSGMDPFLLVGLGAGAFHLDASINDWPPDVAHQSLTTAYLRGEVGGGATWLVASHWVVGVELRYLITGQIDPRDRFLYDDGTQTAVFVFANQHRPPKGFSWSVQAGYRF
ncbi:MAG: hypothetical protein H6733_08225 [Alphaproteobacteria bacterium]|nr:hypothetical protein [Alphaproteobacteria bacterium]